MENYKRCNGCSETKPFSDFYKDNRPGRNVQSKCKDCQRAYKMQNSDRIKGQRKLYYQNNKEQFSKSWKLRYETNPELIKQRSAKWRKENPERFAQQMVSWRLRNPEKHNEAGQKRRARRKANGVFTITKKELKRLYSSACFYCGAKEQITLDHVLPIALGGRHSIGNLVAACRSCNTSKKDTLLIVWLKR